MASGVLIAIEDGTDDGDEAIEPFLIPTWGDGDTAQDVIARYFPHDVDADGMMTAIWTPEYRADTPAGATPRSARGTPCGASTPCPPPTGGTSTPTTWGTEPPT